MLAAAAVSAAVAGASGDDSAAEETRWLVGDLHVHVGPPDAPGHSTLPVSHALDLARRAGLDFVALTPHRADAVVRYTVDGREDANGQELVRSLVRRWLTTLRESEEETDAPPPLVVAGWEWTRSDPGHLGVLFADVRRVAGSETPEEDVLAAGGLVVVNHPFFGPVRSEDPILKMIGPGRLWQPFQEEPRDGAWNAIEVWHDRSVLVERLYAGREDAPPEVRMLSRSLAAWDAVTRESRRRITAVGGSDAHGRLPYAVAPLPVVSVLVDDAGDDAANDEANDEGARLDALRRGLRAARVTFGRGGGAAARDLAATSDVPGESAGIGDALRAQETVTLTWGGTARLIENGVDVGEHDGGTTRRLPEPGAFAFWRIEKEGDAYSNMIYANLPEESAGGR